MSVACLPMAWIAARGSGLVVASLAARAAAASALFRLNEANMGRRAFQYSRSFTRKRAMDWLCSWQMRDSVTLSTAAISFRFMSCS
jgi:hypothetical protein